MNPRIQVEHTVSEEITNIDLVAWQLRIAQGEKLPFTQDDIKLRGWAIEARINAEDPAKDFLPSPGRVNNVRFPAGPGVRVDTHLYSGYEIPSFYDSMVAKLIVWGETREIAMKRMVRALNEFEIDGVPTTAKFHEAVLRHPIFIEGKMNTGFVEQQAEYFKKEFATMPAQFDEHAAILAALVAVEDQQKGQVQAGTSAGNAKPRSRWLDQSRIEGRRN